MEVFEEFIHKKGNNIDQDGCWCVMGGERMESNAVSEENMWLSSAFVSFYHYIYSEIFFVISILFRKGDIFF